MAEERRPVWWLLVILFAGVVYVAGQTIVNWVTPALAMSAYFECLQKVALYDWSKVPGGKPGSGSEICGHLASRTRL